MGKNCVVITTNGLKTYIPLAKLTSVSWEGLDLAVCLTEKGEVKKVKLPVKRRPTESKVVGDATVADTEDLRVLSSDSSSEEDVPHETKESFTLRKIEEEKIRVWIQEEVKSRIGGFSIESIEDTTIKTLKEAKPAFLDELMVPLRLLLDQQLSAMIKTSAVMKKEFDDYKKESERKFGEGLKSVERLTTQVKTVNPKQIDELKFKIENLQAQIGDVKESDLKQGFNLVCRIDECRCVIDDLDKEVQKHLDKNNEIKNTCDGLTALVGKVNEFETAMQAGIEQNATLSKALAVRLVELAQSVSHWKKLPAEFVNTVCDVWNLNNATEESLQIKFNKLNNTLNSFILCVDRVGNNMQETLKEATPRKPDKKK